MTDSPLSAPLLFLSHSTSQSGAPGLLLTLMSWLQHHGHSVCSLVPDDGKLVDAFRELGDTFVMPHRPSIRSDRTSRLKRLLTRTERPLSKEEVIQQVRQRKYSLVYANSIVNGAVLEELSPKVPVITHVHELEYWIEKAGNRNLELVKHHTSHFIAASEAVKKALTQKYGVKASDVSVVHAFIKQPNLPNSRATRDNLRQQLGLEVNDYLLVASGWEFWRKGRDLVPQLLDELQRAHLPGKVHLVWVGMPGTEEEEFRLNFDLAKLGLSSKYHRTGHVSNPHDYFVAGDVFVLPSRDDPFPLVCLEAAFLGLPIVCFDGAGGMPEFVQSDCGRVVRYSNISDMANAIAELLNSKELRSRAADCAKSKVQANLTVETAAPKIFKIILDTITNHSGGTIA